MRGACDSRGDTCMLSIGSFFSLGSLLRGAMSETYRIIRTHGTVVDLEKAIVALGDVQIHGAPFRDERMMEWCQAVSMRMGKPNEVRLREKK